MATFRKRGSKWQVQVRIKGQPPLSRSFSTKPLAVEWAKEVERGEVRKASNITLQALLDEYLTITPSKVDRAFIQTFISRCHFLNKSVSKLTETDFLEYRTEQLKVCKASSYNRAMKPILGAFRYAVDHKRFPKDCADVLKATKLKTKATKRRRRFFKDEQERFNLFCSCPTLVAVVTVLVETGMRSGELFLVQKDWIRMGFIYLPQDVTKTENPRTVALSPRALSAVEVLAAASKTEKLVPLSAGVLKKKFCKVRDAAGLGDLHIHDLRHEALSRLSETGLFGPAELMAMSGHTQLAQLADYIHASPSLIQQKLKSLDQSQR